MEVVGQAIIDMHDSVDPRVTLEAALIRLTSPEVMTARLRSWSASSAWSAWSPSVRRPTFLRSRWVGRRPGRRRIDWPTSRFAPNLLCAPRLTTAGEGRQRPGSSAL